MTVEELHARLGELIDGGHGPSEVQLRTSMGGRAMIRTDVNGIAHEIGGPHDKPKKIVLLWGRTA